MGPLKHELTTKFMQQNARGKLPDSAPPTKVTVMPTQAVSEEAAEFQIAEILLYSGQGKINKLETWHCTNISVMSTSLDYVNMGEWVGLHPPQLKAMGGTICGNEKMILHKENKLHWRHLKLGKIDRTQWTVHGSPGGNEPINNNTT